MAAPQKILQLVERFDSNIDAYKQGKYNETQVRREFIDPLFTCLGWDVENTQGHAEAYKDVVHEDAIKIGRATKAPDYSFRIGGVRKFFVEAKKPSISIKEDIHPAYQLRRYAWSAKLPLSILTDFEEFAVYDCRVKPEHTDKASTARIMYLTFAEYAPKWEELTNVFSKDAILKGAFDRYAESAKAKKGTAEVDVAFLQEIERWRDLLARNLALRNPQLTRRDLNFAVQRTIDRIIFLRICEDRGVEAYGKLQALLNGANVYARLLQSFYQADDRYNSGIFHFKTERDHAEAPDGLTPALQIDDKVLKDILNNLYYPDSPYEFSVLPADILGQVYEQFLGKVIRLTDGHQAKVEEKPEVKKAGGVYYTPTYIVEYIVKNTVGKLLEEKTLPGFKTLAGLELTILDPACGSGSFLIGAYQYLLDWHRAAYLADPAKWSKGRPPRLYRNAQGEWKLTIEERKRILLSHIYGVDIDAQAVEVTKLSLLLKVLEGEDEQTLNSQLSMFQKRVLPDLSNNIKCGNSLIGSDFYAGQQLLLLDEEEKYRINIFDWDGKDGFPDIMKNGGFDVVIGNPPYIRIQAMKEWAPLEVEFYKKRYISASKGNYDIYVVFVEKGLRLLNNMGTLGFILPHKFFNAQYGEQLRKIVAEGKYLSHVVHFGANQVFNGATTYTCLLFLDKVGKESFRFARAENLDEWRMSQQAQEGIISSLNITATEWNFTVGNDAALCERFLKMPIKLGNIADIFVGLQTSADDVFIMELIKETDDFFRLYSKALDTEYDFEKHLFFPLVSGTDVNRYHDLPERQYILFPYNVENDSVELISFEEIVRSAPKTAAYLKENKTRLEQRERGKAKGERWYGYIYLKNMARQSKKKLCIPRLVDKLYAAYDVNGNHFLDNVDVGGITLKDVYQQHSLLYLLGLLNSALLRWYFPHVSAPFRGGWLSANRQFLSQLPIYIVNFSDPTDKANHEKIVTLVEQMLTLHKQLGEATNPQAHTFVQRQIETTDRQIDRLVYELYGLTEEEIQIVEGAS